MILRDSAGNRLASSGLGVQGAGGMKVYGSDGRRRDIPSSGGLRRPSFDNPPVSAGAYDDEFEGTLGNWTFGGTATTPAAGTVNPVASVATTPVYNLNDQWPSWLLMQSDDASNETIDMTRDYSPATNETFFLRVAVNVKAMSTTNEGDFYLVLTNSGDANETVFIGITHTSTGTNWSFGVNNNGATTTRSGNVETFPLPSSGIYFLLYKTSNSYLGFVLGESGTHIQMGAAIAKTGVTAFDKLNLRFHTANETPSTFWGVDFVRYYPTNSLSLVNP